MCDVLPLGQKFRIIWGKKILDKIRWNWYRQNMYVNKFVTNINNRKNNFGDNFYAYVLFMEYWIIWILFWIVSPWFPKNYELVLCFGIYYAPRAPSLVQDAQKLLRHFYGNSGYPFHTERLIPKSTYEIMHTADICKIYCRICEFLG
jgi:hypothetical protein